jgi:1,4-alpha-glucan branching enzyme
MSDVDAYGVRNGLPPEAEAIIQAAHPNPHTYLGVHEVDRRPWLRVWRPEASKIVALLAEGARVPLEQRHPAGLFDGRLPATPTSYGLEITFHSGATIVVDDPYRFWPTLGDVDLHLIGEGRHERLWEVLGSHPMVHQGVRGTAFAVWAPAATSVRVAGDFNHWNGSTHPMRALGSSGVWELFIPGAGQWDRYKYEVVTHDGRIMLKADPYAQFSERPPGSASIVVESAYIWGDDGWIEARAAADPMHDRLSIYEVHLGSWKRVPEEGERPLSYRELADQLSEYVRDLGFTHVELMPVMEHPYGGSWGYQVSGYFSPTSRFGTPDDLRYFVDKMHQAGIGVIVDWVPAHFPRDEWALARFDGTALYEHADPRLGEHPDWGTLVFNFGRHEVRNFLLANALYWIEEFHMDGLRVDAVASMLYLDYSREPGQWVPNIHGGRENLQAIAFLQEFNSVVHLRHPGVLTVAEESTAWGGVSRPVSAGGLGFTHKWNMGWMHDTLGYFGQNPVHRKYHHNELTFALMYAWTENFVLPLSHDEVVHLKRSLLKKMPGDRWQQLANLRALLAWMWAHPGKQLLFMGGELAQEEEWAHDRSLDWHLLDLPEHRGVMEMVKQINQIQESESALWADDFSPEGFAWIDADDADHSVYSFLRASAGGGRSVACIANLTPVPRHGYRVGLPDDGAWTELLSTDDARWGGSGIVNPSITTDDITWQGFDQSAVLTLPPLAVLWLAPEVRAEPPEPVDAAVTSTATPAPPADRSGTEPRNPATDAETKAQAKTVAETPRPR